MSKYALLIGVSQYQSFDALPGVKKDVEAMHAILTNPNMGGFDRVHPLIDPSSQAVKRSIEELFSEGCTAEDVLLFYFSGHGFCNETGKLFFVTSETQKKKEQEQIYEYQAVAAEFLQDWMSRSRSQRQVVILDCCFSGAFAQGMTARKLSAIEVDLATQLGGEGRAVLTASTATQMAYENQEGGVYTQYLVEGIATGAADVNNEGVITVDAMHQYAKRKTQEAKPAMKPEIYAVREGYSIRLAKAPIDDPPVQYRKEVEKCLRDDGTISGIGRRILLRRQTALQLTNSQVDAIETDVLAPFRVRQQSLQDYREAVQDAIEQENPLSEATWTELKRYQQVLELRDEDVEAIVAPLVAGLLAPTVQPDRVEPRSMNSAIAGLQAFSFEVVTVDAKGQETQRQTKQAQRLVEDLGNGVTLEMVVIPAGSFRMGSPTDEEGRRDRESPQHSVTVSEFLMGRYAVTQAQYEAIVGNNPAKFKGANRPVEQVSWNEAQEFCRKLSEKTGRRYRLPSEAEWEYACRAGTTTPFHFGETITTDLANYRGTDWEYQGTTYSGNYGAGPKGKFREQTIDIGSFPANAFGLHDMHGNVLEWCEDVYHENYQGAPIDGSAWIEGGKQDRRLLRGGSWFNGPRGCRSACRDYDDPDYRYDNVGFRVACSSAWTS